MRPLNMEGSGIVLKPGLKSFFRGFPAWEDRDKGLAISSLTPPRLIREIFFRGCRWYPPRGPGDFHPLSPRKETASQTCSVFVARIHAARSRNEKQGHLQGKTSMGRKYDPRTNSPCTKGRCHHEADKNPVFKRKTGPRAPQCNPGGRLGREGP